MEIVLAVAYNISLGTEEGIKRISLSSRVEKLNRICHLIHNDLLSDYKSMHVAECITVGSPVYYAIHDLFSSLLLF